MHLIDTKILWQAYVHYLQGVVPLLDDSKMESAKNRHHYHHRPNIYQLVLSINPLIFCIGGYYIIVALGISNHQLVLPINPLIFCIGDYYIIVALDTPHLVLPTFVPFFMILYCARLLLLLIFSCFFTSLSLQSAFPNLYPSF